MVCTIYSPCSIVHISASRFCRDACFSSKLYLSSVFYNRSDDCGCCDGIMYRSSHLVTSEFIAETTIIRVTTIFYLTATGDEIILKGLITPIGLLYCCSIECDQSLTADHYLMVDEGLILLACVWQDLCWKQECIFVDENDRILCRTSGEYKASCMKQVGLLSSRWRAYRIRKTITQGIEDIFILTTDTLLFRSRWFWSFMTVLCLSKYDLCRDRICLQC